MGCSTHDADVGSSAALLVGTGCDVEKIPMTCLRESLVCHSACLTCICPLYSVCAAAKALRPGLGFFARHGLLPDHARDGGMPAKVCFALSVLEHILDMSQHWNLQTAVWPSSQCEL